MSTTDQNTHTQRHESRPDGISELEARIQKSRQAIAAYPAWVRNSMVFHGGGVRRSDPDEPTP